MSRDIGELALFGGVPALRAIGTGSPHRRQAIADGLRDVFDRRYFANNGPLVQRLDRSLAEVTGTRHAICTANPAAAWLILGKALGLVSPLVLPVLGPRSLAAVTAWTGLTPAYGDVSSDDGALARLFDGPTLHPAATVHLLDLPGGISTAGGACITTDDDRLAADLKARRAFHPTPQPIGLRLNGKMSEGQAAVALAGLAELRSQGMDERACLAAFAGALGPDVGLQPMAAVDRTLPRAACRLRVAEGHDLDAADYCRILKAEGLPCGGLEWAAAVDPDTYPGAVRARAVLFEVAIGHSTAEAAAVGAFIRGVALAARRIRAGLGARP